MVPHFEEHERKMRRTFQTMSVLLVVLSLFITSDAFWSDVFDHRKGLVEWSGRGNNDYLVASYSNGEVVGNGNEKLVGGLSERRGARMLTERHENTPSSAEQSGTV